MNEAYQNLLQRRSIRQYQASPVEMDKLLLIAQAGTYAPSSMGRQATKIVIVNDSETISQLSALNAQVMGKQADPFYEAPAQLIVFADTTNPATYRQDGALVMQNLMLAAHALGLGSCWINRAKEVFETPYGKSLKQKWGIEDCYEGIGHCIVGYPLSQTLPTAPQRKPDRIIIDK